MIIQKIKSILRGAIQNMGLTTNVLRIVPKPPHQLEAIFTCESSKSGAKNKYTSERSKEQTNSLLMAVLMWEKE